jgi:hypothetical protein
MAPWTELLWCETEDAGDVLFRELLWQLCHRLANVLGKRSVGRGARRGTGAASGAGAGVFSSRAYSCSRFGAEPRSLSEGIGNHLSRNHCLRRERGSGDESPSDSGQRIGDVGAQVVHEAVTECAGVGEQVFGLVLLLRGEQRADFGDDLAAAYGELRLGLGDGR